MDSSLGFIQDEEDLAVPNATLAYTNKKYKYELRVPETWTTNSYGLKKDNPMQSYNFIGGNVQVNADDSSSLEDVWKKAEAAFKKNVGNDKNYKYKVTEEKRFNAAVKKVEISYPIKDAPYKETQYIFKKNDIVYTVTLHINDAVHTEQNEKQLKQVWNSFLLQ
jgi:serine protease Do